MNRDKDYYSILGITDDEKKLNQEEFKKVITKKFRQLSLKYHPDRHVNDSDEEKKIAEEKFKEISEAYDVLSDEKKKAQYDSPFSSNGGRGFNPFEGFGFNPFDFMNPFRSRNQRQEPKVQKGDSIRINLSIPLEEVFSGVEKTIKYKRNEPCHKCHGSGLGENGKVETCPTCGGTGMDFQEHGNIQMMSTCKQCKGTGKIITNPCSCCGGSGLEAVEHEVTFKIPQGIMDGDEIRLQGEGSLSVDKNGIPGDLFIVITTKKHDIFVRRGNDLLFELKIPILDAILGQKQNVTTIDGKVLETKIPQGIEDGENIRFANKGLPIYGKNNRFGHMIGIVKLIMPKSLNDEEKRLIEELKQQEHFKN